MNKNKNSFLSFERAKINLKFYVCSFFCYIRNLMSQKNFSRITLKFEFGHIRFKKEEVLAFVSLPLQIFLRTLITARTNQENIIALGQALTQATFPKMIIAPYQVNRILKFYINNYYNLFCLQL